MAQTVEYHGSLVASKSVIPSAAFNSRLSLPADGIHVKSGDCRSRGCRLLSAKFSITLNMVMRLEISCWSLRITLFWDIFLELP
jgi:hypothetical protein